MKLIDQLYTENYKLGQRTQELLILLTEPASKHFAKIKSDLNPYKWSFQNSKPNYKEVCGIDTTSAKSGKTWPSPCNLDLIMSINKQTGAQWSDNSKTMFALILDFGGPALANQIRERFGGPSLATLYRIVWLPYKIPQTLEQLSFACARDFFLTFRDRETIHSCSWCNSCYTVSEGTWKQDLLAGPERSSCC